VIDAVAAAAGRQPGMLDSAETVRRALASRLHVAGIELARTRGLPDPADVVQENFPYLGP